MRRDITANAQAIDPLIYFNSIRNEIIATLRAAMELHSNVIWVLGTVTLFERTVEGELQETPFEFYTEAQRLLSPTKLLRKSKSPSLSYS